MNKRQEKMTARENDQNFADRKKCLHNLPPVNEKQKMTEKQRKVIHTHTHTRTYPLHKLKKIFHKSQERQTRNEDIFWKVTQEKDTKYLMLRESGCDMLLSNRTVTSLHSKP